MRDVTVVCVTVTSSQTGKNRLDEHVERRF